MLVAHRGTAAASGAREDAQGAGPSPGRAAAEPEEQMIADSLGYIISAGFSVSAPAAPSSASAQSGS